jgi:CheY-like chemotaxis protein
VKTILVIEYDIDNRELIRDILRRSGYSVTLLPEVPPIGYISSNKPGVILLDQKLKNESGTELCRQLKANRDTKHIPIVIVSTNPDIESIARDCEAETYIAKPFDIDLFSDTFKRVLSKR